jgi:PncC family amidohydrolase
VIRRLGDRVFTTADEDLAEVVGELLKDDGKTVATAESMTAGTLAARLSWPPGASEYFVGGAVTYTAQAKQRILEVSTETLEGPGVVSEECAREMASGARKLFGADIGIAVTGAAGPEPHGGKPAGTVCIAVAGQSAVESRTFRAPGDREQVRRWAEQGALDLARRHLQSERGRIASEARTAGSSH